MHGQARELRQDRKVATVTTSYQCRGVPGHFFYSTGSWRIGRKRTHTGVPIVTLWPVGVSRPLSPLMANITSELPS